LFHEPGRVPDEQKLSASAQLLRHRGPDAQSTYACNGIGLAHTRLSILDLNPRSNQPFWDHAHENCLVYNGEVYNFQALRAELERAGVQFHTTSDTEVVLESLLHWGIDKALTKLEGMYAFAFFNAKDESLVLARDHFGIKPLFVYDGDDQFVFSSEIQAMRPWVPFEADVLSISAYLQSGNRPGNFSIPTKNQSFYKDIRIVPPGCKIEVRRGSRARYSQFFTVGDLLDADERERLKRLKPESVVDELDERLQKSVREQQVADAPLGALCGGGVDSALILALATKYHNDLTIFHADVVDCSEYDVAVELAKFVKVDLKSVQVSSQTILDTLDTVMESYGHPYTYHPSSVPYYAVSKLVRENGVKAVLTGEGSDECFIGYPWKVGNLRQGMNRRIKQFVKSARGHTTNGKVANHIAELHTRFEKSLELDEIREKHNRLFGNDWNERDLISFELLGYHLRTILHQTDCLGMAASVESRFPLLDLSVVKLAVNMPYSLKVRFNPTSSHHRHPFLIDKWVLRQVAARYIPPMLYKRPKMGFPVPAVARIQPRPEFFRESFVGGLFGLSRPEMDYFIEHADNELIHKLMFLELWAQVCLIGAPKDGIRRHLESNLQFANAN
jgi:asparagine synthase (glutamine-hydrolysing)